VTARRVLVLGGARSGKSAHAEQLLSEHDSVDYVATSRTGTDDVEWAARVAAHRERRPASWRTIETTDLAGVLTTPGPPALVDSVTAWLASAMDAAEVWLGADDGDDAQLAAAVDALVAAWSATSRFVVAVSDEVGGGIVPDSKSGRLFRDELGSLNQRLAAAADEVWLVTAGIPLRLR
jgi:adenosylcobinamide kinase/adenosylcobinamide-phosphate guanylyltransferase